MQGALGGGGYSCELSMSDDGLTMITRSDTHQVNIFNRSTQMWEDIFNAKRFNGMKWAQGGGAHAIAVAPGDSNRIYVCSSGIEKRIGSRQQVHKQLHCFSQRRSRRHLYSDRDDHGPRGHRRQSHRQPQDGCGSKQRRHRLRCQPDGNLWVTYNGGADWSLVKPLLSALSTCQVQAPAKPQASSIVVGSNAVTALVKSAGAAGYQVYAYDITRPSAIGQDALQDAVMGAKIDGATTTLNLQSWVQSQGVSINDTIYLGASGYVAIDKTSGTLPNPGIALGVNGAKGVASKSVLRLGMGRCLDVAFDRWRREFFSVERRAISSRQT